jgi:hypothetical protein
MSESKKGKFVTTFFFSIYNTCNKALSSERREVWSKLICVTRDVYDSLFLGVFVRELGV